MTDKQLRRVSAIGAPVLAVMIVLGLMGLRFERQFFGVCLAGLGPSLLAMLALARSGAPRPAWGALVAAWFPALALALLILSEGNNFDAEAVRMVALLAGAAVTGMMVAALLRVAAGRSVPRAVLAMCGGLLLLYALLLARAAGRDPSGFTLPFGRGLAPHLYRIGFVVSILASGGAAVVAALLALERTKAHQVALARWGLGACCLSVLADAVFPVLLVLERPSGRAFGGAILIAAWWATPATASMVGVSALVQEP